MKPKIIALAQYFFGITVGLVTNSFPDDSATSLNTRPLKWGELNILHTTDTHTWLPGHLNEPLYSANYGDLFSFHQRLLDITPNTSDLLFVDSGDRHDGNGFGDAQNPKGLWSERIFSEVDYDIVTIGNHELYKWESTYQELDIVAPKLGERFVVSNVDYLSDDKTHWIPLGNKYRRFKTTNRGLNVVAFGYVFDFGGGNSNVRVQKCFSTTHSDWFQEALSYEDTDVFLIVGHIPIRNSPEIKAILSAIRQKWPNKLVLFMGGHSHIRDFAVYDNKSVGLESGRFLETVGWLSLNGTTEDSKSTYFRSYIDFNRKSLTFHTKTSEQSFDTPKGLSLTKKIFELRQKFSLDDQFGHVPKSFWTSRAPYPGPDSLFSLLADRVLPRLEAKTVSRERSLEHPRHILINTGSIRFDLISGPYTRDSAYIISPFENNWMYFPDVPKSVARQLLEALNRLPYIASSIKTPEGDDMYLKLPEQRRLSYNLQHSNNLEEGQKILKNKDLTLGYVTIDDYGQDGDDTPHKPYPFTLLPNVIQAEQNIPDNGEEVAIDIVIYDFLLPYVFTAFEQIGHPVSSALPYGGNSTVELLTEFIRTEWPIKQ